MSLFKKFEEKAKNKVGDIKNAPERVDPKKFRDPTRDNQQYIPPEDQGEVFEDLYEEDDPINLYPAQKPESFHFFILENQYQDLERMIRGVKDVWDKDKQKWVIKRKAEHCFTDEESEDIVRTAQSHLSSDIKLAILNRQEYPILLQGIYDQLWVMFKETMDYRFGRFGNETKQAKMKLQAANIFNALMMRIKANYSRAIEGRENSSTHDSVKGQESLQQTERKEFERAYS